MAYLDKDGNVCMSSTVEDVHIFAKGPVWSDIEALIRGRIAEITQEMCFPEKTPDVAQLRLLQGARNELVVLAELPGLIVAEINAAKEEAEIEENEHV